MGIYEAKTERIAKSTIKTNLRTSSKNDGDRAVENQSNRKSFAVDCKNLPAGFPTHKHSVEFWEALGRAVSTFGFLEETLGKAIFAFTGTRQIPEDKIEKELDDWHHTLERALSDQLGGLIKSYGKAVRANDNSTIINLEDLLTDLRNASIYRNVICHGSWRAPDEHGRSLPLFVDRENRVWDRPIDIALLKQVQRHTVDLICAVVDTVTRMGWQFPGTSGPGNPIYQP